MSAITKKKVIKWIWIIGGVLFIVPILLFFFSIGANFIGYVLVFGFLLLLVNIFLVFKFYNLIIVFILVELLGLSFKFFHYPGADVILIFETILQIIALSKAFISFLKKNDLPRYINRFGAAASLVAAFTFLALLFKISHYPGGRYMDYISVSMLIIIILALVFTLPNSKFVDWSKQARTIFFRALIIPITFLFLITATFKLYPNIIHINNDESSSKFFFDKVVLHNKEGLVNKE